MKFHLILFLFLFYTTISGSGLIRFAESKEVSESAIELNIRFHIMQGKSWKHPRRVEMNTWVTAEDIKEKVLPEINSLYSQSDIRWKLERIIKEPYHEYEGDTQDVQFIINTKRDKNGRSDKRRLPRLYRLMNPEFMSSQYEVEGNLFHIYIFPFIGNTSQGNAMRPYGFHSVVGSWTNKHNRGKAPEKTLLIESQTAFIRGSLARTIAHELGHVLGLRHDCKNCLMAGKGYGINKQQIKTMRKEALRRLNYSSRSNTRLKNSK